MKRFIPFVLLFCNVVMVQSQITSPAKRANFGADADLRANFFNGFIDAGNDDWYNNGTAGTGTFVIDTTGANYIIQQYINNPATRMIPFFRGMRFPQFSVVNNMMLIDGIFIRDHHGDDSTVFALGSNKNGMSPVNWSCPVSQGIPDKNDILDIFMHVRRGGPSSTDSLWMFGGVSIENTTGNRYFDFEMYQTDIYFDRSTLSFKGYGPDAGHTSWLFDASGNVLQTGDIIFTAEYSSSSLTLVEARIWVNNSALSITPTSFNWGGSFDGASAGATYGYANILPKSAGSFYTGLQCSNNTWAGPFGVIRQDNSLVFDYNTRQFMEFSVNLSKLGLDPLVNVGDPCQMPFRRILVKTRASTSFSAELKDFVGPFDFFRAPMASASADIPIFCGVVGISNISVSNPLATSKYIWSTPDGHIVSDSVGYSITVDQPGTYIVSQELMDSCGSSYARDTVLVTYDASCGVLGSELVSFSGQLKDKQVALSWTVNNNPISYYYTIERSYDGQNFTEARRIYRTGETSQVGIYNYTDEVQPAVSGFIFYRLKIVDKTGKYSYSRVIAVMVKEGSQKAVVIMPNPVKKTARLVITGLQDEEVNISLIDLAGKELRNNKVKLVKGTSMVELDNLDRWTSGVYIIKVTMSNRVHTAKLVLSK